MEPISSPVELDESGWRPRIRGVTRIGAKAGLIAFLLLAVLVVLIIYGISTAGHRRASVAHVTLTRAAQQPKPWWSALPDAPATPLVLPSIAPRVQRVPAITAPTSTNDRAAVLAAVSAAQAQAEELRREAVQRREALVDAANSAPVTVQLSSEVTPSQLPTLGRAGSNAPSDYVIAQVQRDSSPYELHAGSVIPATLLTGIDAALPGTIVAQVRENVYDSVTGRALLIPRGSRLIGTYDSRVVQGQHRVLVTWARLLYPNGQSFDLPALEGVDPAGYAGLAASVDEHLSKTFNRALLLSIIGAGAQLSQPQRSANVNGVPDLGQTIAAAIGQQIGNTSIQLTQQQLQEPPTVQVPPGYLFGVLVNRDIVLPAPYAEGAP